MSDFKELLKNKDVPFVAHDICVARLISEWQKHGKIVVAVDFDDTVFDYHNVSCSFDRVIDALQDCRDIGAYITVFTASDNNRHDFIRDHMSSIGVEIDSINKNAIDLPFGNEGKIFYNIFLDDRAGLESALHILEEAIKAMKLLKNMCDDIME